MDWVKLNTAHVLYTSENTHRCKDVMDWMKLNTAHLL